MLSILSRDEVHGRARYGGSWTAAMRHATYTTRKNTVKSFPKRQRSHSNSKLNPRNGARKIAFLNPHWHRDLQATDYARVGTARIKVYAAE